MNLDVNTKPNFRFLGTEAKPFLKWAGGKRFLAPTLAKYLPKKFNLYCEPFLGGGAFFFHLQPRCAFLSDVNPEVVNAFRVVRDYPHDLVEALSKHIYDKDYYYSVRAQNPFDLDSVSQAARTLYLNRVGYNGLYRVNRKGEFNVPFGRYENPRIVDVENILACSQALYGVLIDTISVETYPWEILRRGDFVYFDPPYVPLSVTSSFTSYASDGFGMREQEKLAEIFRELASRGIAAMLTNSSAPRTYELYKGFKLIEVSVPRPINSRGKDRGEVKEVVVFNYEI